MNQKNGKNSLGIDSCFEDLDNPIELFKKWFAKAEKTEINDPNAVAVATSNKNNQPNVRMVLLKGLSDKGFVFYTNFNSKKGNEIKENLKASMCFHWKSLRRQVRVIGSVEEVTKKEADKECMKVRTDGVSVDIDGDYTETLASIASNKEGIGVFGLSFLLNNTDTIYASKVNGIMPSTETIASGEYPISRPLQFYVKNAHIGQIPGLKEYIQFFVSDEIAGPDGPLAEYGLVSDPELAKTQAMVDGL